MKRKEIMKKVEKTPKGTADRSEKKWRTLNVKFVAGLLVTTAFLAGGVHLLHGAQVKRNSVALKHRAELALSEQKLDEAVIYLRRYLGFQPNDLESLTNLGLTLDKLAKSPKQLVQVFFTLDRVLRMDPDRSDIRRRLAEIAMDINRYNDAIYHLTSLHEATPDDAELEHRPSVTLARLKSLIVRQFCMSQRRSRVTFGLHFCKGNSNSCIRQKSK
jgi:tetratricopeptide (TPR) repeat protein